MRAFAGMGQHAWVRPLITVGLIAGAVVVATQPSGVASAATVSDSATLAVDLDAPGSGVLDAFDPALGTLTSVRVTIDADVFLQNCIENLSTDSGSTIGGPVDGRLAVEFPDGQNATEALVDTTIPETTLPESDGSDQCADQLDTATVQYDAPVVAEDVAFFQHEDSASSDETYTDPATFAPFIGPGTVAFTYDSASMADITQPSEWDIVFVAKGSLAVSVTYTYEPTPTTTVPCVPPGSTTVPSGPTTTVPGGPVPTTTPVPCETPTTTTVPCVPPGATTVPSGPTTTAPGGGAPTTTVLCAPGPTTTVPCVPPGGTSTGGGVTVPCATLPRTGPATDGAIPLAAVLLCAGLGALAISGRFRRPAA